MMILLLLCFILADVSLSLSSMLPILSLAISTTPSLSLKRIDESRKHIEDLYRIDFLLSEIEDNYDSDSRRKLAKICLELYNLKLGEKLSINNCHECMYSTNVTTLYELCGLEIDNSINNNDNILSFKKKNISTTPSIIYILKDHTNKKLDSDDLKKKIVTENKIKSLFKVAGESTNIGNDKNNNNNENNDRKSINNDDDNNDDDKTTRSLVLAAWNENQKDDKRLLSTSSHKIWMKYCTRYISIYIILFK